MTAAVTARKLPRRAARAWRWVRDAHPVTVLRWLRNGMLAAVAATAVLYLWVALQARQDIGTVRHFEQAAQAVQQASADVTKAQDALSFSLAYGGITGPQYLSNTIAASQPLASLSGTSVPGVDEGLRSVSRQMGIYLAVSGSADDAANGPATQARLLAACAKQEELTVQAGLAGLRSAEQKAARVQRGAWPLNPAAFWPVLLVPVLVLVLLAAAAVRVLARHFRRHPSPWLGAALALSAVTTGTVGFFNLNDAWHTSADPWAGYPATIIAALLLYATAGVLIHLALRPRLAEYEFLPQREIHA